MKSICSLSLPPLSLGFFLTHEHTQSIVSIINHRCSLRTVSCWRCTFSLVSFLPTIEQVENRSLPCACLRLWRCHSSTRRRRRPSSSFDPLFLFSRSTAIYCLSLRDRHFHPQEKEQIHTRCVFSPLDYWVGDIYAWFRFETNDFDSGRIERVAHCIISPFPDRDISKGFRCSIFIARSNINSFFSLSLSVLFFYRDVSFVGKYIYTSIHLYIHLSIDRRILFFSRWWRTIDEPNCLVWTKNCHSRPSSRILRRWATKDNDTLNDDLCFISKVWPWVGYLVRPSLWITV